MIQLIVYGLGGLCLLLAVGCAWLWFALREAERREDLRERRRLAETYYRADRSLAHWQKLERAAEGLSAREGA